MFSEIKRCEEMERKLRYIETEIRREEINIDQVGTSLFPFLHSFLLYSFLLNSFILYIFIFYIVSFFIVNFNIVSFNIVSFFIHSFLGVVFFFI